MSDLSFLHMWPMPRLEALYRVAKKSGMFKDPKVMIGLRQIVEARRKGLNSK